MIRIPQWVGISLFSTAYRLPLDPSASVTVDTVGRNLCRHPNFMVLYFHALLGMVRSCLHKYIFYLYNQQLFYVAAIDRNRLWSQLLIWKQFQRLVHILPHPREILKAGGKFFLCGLKNLSISSWLICLVGCLSKWPAIQISEQQMIKQANVSHSKYLREFLSERQWL